MTGDLFIVSKGNTRIQLADKVSALHLVSTLAALECTEPITSSKISGCKDYGDVYEVCFLDKAIRIAGQREAEQVLNWMLTYGCSKVSIEKLSKEEIQNESEVH